MSSTMTLHNFIRDYHKTNNDFVLWEIVKDYYLHGDQVVENDEEDEGDGEHVRADW